MILETLAAFSSLAAPSEVARTHHNSMTLKEVIAGLRSDGALALRISYDHGTTCIRARFSDTVRLVEITPEGVFVRVHPLDEAEV